MTTQELIEARKRRIKLSVAGYDQTLRLSGKMSLMNIINKIDSTSVPSNDDSDAMGNYINSLYNTTTAVLRFANTKAMRTNKRAYQWLQSEHNTQEVWATIRMYALLGAEVYTVSEEAIKYMYDNFISKDSDPYKYVLFNKDYEFEPMATYNYTVMFNAFDKEGRVISETEDFGIVCSNRECPYHKASLAPEYSDGSKRVDCTVQDCKKCKAFNSGVLSPLDLLNAVATVVYSYENRQQNTRVINEGAKVEYGALPLPMSDTPVVIYTDTINNNEKVVRIINHDEDYIPGTHASPREHSRAEHMRYNPRTGKKDIHVNGCTVNKGYTKTTYEIKTHKHKKVEKDPEITIKGQSMINELLQSI